MRFLFAALAATRIAAACSCAPSAYAPLCQRIDQVKVLFIGTAIETNDDHDGFIKGGLWYRFSVEEVFKGVDSTVREVLVDPASGTSCQDEFEMGKRYLISSYGSTIGAQQASAISLVGYPAANGKARPPGPVVVTGVFSGSRQIERAAEDIEFVRGYVAFPQQARIFGSVRSHASEFFWDERYPPLGGARIAITGPNGKAIRTTDSDGHFELQDVQPGRYTLTAVLAGFTATRTTYDVNVPAHGCGVANIGMFTNAVVSGKVLHNDGSLARDVQVEIVLAEGKYRRAYLPGSRTKTDAEGTFRISGMPAGEFVLGVHIDSAPRAKEGILPTYWPSAVTENRATRIRLKPNEQRNNLVIRLGPRAPVRRITVRVKWPDGRPAGDTGVSARVNNSVAELGKTDQSGFYQVLLLAGVAYSFESRAWTSYRNVNGNKIGDNFVDAEPISLAAGAGPAEITLVLNKPRQKR